jgi:hypothetical protein
VIPVPSAEKRFLVPALPGEGTISMLKYSSITYKDDAKNQWFFDDEFDLIIWIDRDETISGFQLCYDKHGTERALTWKKASGYTHERVDSGEEDPTKNRTPILVSDGICPIQEITELFLLRSTEIDPSIRTFVEARLREYSAGKNV